MKKLASALALLLVLPLTVFADSIDPATFDATLGVGESVTITKRVTIDDAPPTDIPVDVFFLADVTGSMGDAIAAVRVSASAILNDPGIIGDVQWGVGQYRDIFDSAPVNPYELQVDITADTMAVQTGINAWFADGGGDTPEGQLPALKSVAEDTTWRAGSTRILVWFGDAPGHDPRDGVSEADATDALQAAGVEVQAISVTSGAGGLTAQATAIAAATGGEHRIGVDSDAIAAEIIAAIGSAISTYSVVSLDTSEAPAGVDVSFDPAEYVGTFDRSIVRTFDFEVTFEGVDPGDYEFPIYATVDRGRVAREIDTIRVGGGGASVPEPASLGLLGLGLLGLGWAKRRLA